MNPNALARFLLLRAGGVPRKRAGLCVHQRRASYCRDCGGAQICDHGKVRSQCRECGGTAFCDHGRRQSSCALCGGTEVCLHFKLVKDCAECRPANRSTFRSNKTRTSCEHADRKDNCIVCSGCEHNYIRTRCRICSGSRCVHGRRQRRCVDCLGGLPDVPSVCVHGRMHYYCVPCKGGGVCEHQRRRSDGRVCHYGVLCPHTCGADTVAQSASAPAVAPTGGSASNARIAGARASAGTAVRSRFVASVTRLGCVVARACANIFVFVRNVVPAAASRVVMV